MSDIFYELVAKTVSVKRREELDGLASSHYKGVDGKIKVWGIRPNNTFPENFRPPDNVEYIGHLYLLDTDYENVKSFFHFHEEKTKDGNRIGIIHQALKILDKQEDITFIPSVDITKDWFWFWKNYYMDKFSSDRSKYNSFVNKHGLKDRLSVLESKCMRDDIEMDLNN